MQAHEQAQSLAERGRAALQAGQPEAALRFYDGALSHDPDFVPALHGRCQVFQALGQSGDVVAACEQALRRTPDDAGLYYSHGVGLRHLGRLSEAEASFRRAIAIAPKHYVYHAGLAGVLEAQIRLAEARASYDVALALNPDDADSLNNLGNLLNRLGDAAGAEASLRRAIAVRPSFVEALNNLGTVQAAQENLVAAIATYREALALRPAFLPALVNMGAALADAGEPREAIAAYDRALAIEPGNASARWNRGLARLLLGDFTGGWQDYQARWNTADFRARRRAFPQAPWRGESLAGKSILLWAEQGIGDEMMFLGFAQELMAAGAKVALECDRRLVPLLARSLPEIETIARRDPPDPRTSSADFSFQAPTGDLLARLRPSRGSVNPLGGYLRVDSMRTAELRKRFVSSGSRRLIGLSWHSANPAAGKRRSIPAGQLAPFLKLPDWGAVDLQYGNRSGDRAALKQQTGRELLHDPTIDAMQDLDGWAAAIAAVDVVVSIDNSAVHLAAALGKPVLLLLPTAPDWRWFERGEWAAWYPDVRLLRQTRRGDWQGPIAQALEIMSAWPA